MFLFRSGDNFTLSEIVYQSFLSLEFKTVLFYFMSSTLHVIS